MSELRLGTRGSLLALTQSGLVRDALAARGHRVSLVTIHTTGDGDQATPLSRIGGKGLFTRELDVALLDGRVDFAVHSLKDLPTESEPGLRLAAVGEREDPRDVLLGRAGGGGRISLTLLDRVDDSISRKTLYQVKMVTRVLRRSNRLPRVFFTARRGPG